MTDTPAVIREFYSSDDDDSRLRMGPMRFPILDKAIELGAGTWWTVTRYFYPNSIQQYRSLEALVKGSGYQTVKVSERIAHVPTGSTIDNIINVNAIGGKVTVIRGDWKLSDIGLTLYQNCVTDADGTVTTIPGKEAKRMKAFARPFRIHTAREKLNVLVVEAKTYHEVYDGASLISDTLVNECVDNLSYPNQEDYIYNKTRSWFLDQMVFNGLIIGNLFNAETGLNLDRMIKGQFFRTRLPEGIDIVTSPDNLKHEIIGNKYAFVGIDPQGPKVAKEDQQTVANHWFLCPPSIAKIRLEDEAFIKKQEVFDGKFNQSLKDLVSKSYRTDNAYSETSFASLMKWRINAWAAHGMDYRNSTWLTTRISDIWPKSLGDRTANWNNSLKVNVPCAIRAQVICESMYNLWRHFEGQLPITVPDGYLHFSEQLKLGVVSDEDWVNIVIPSHGGCDQDDFFMLRWVMLIETLEPGQSNKRIIIHRNPNTRGEYSVWKVLEDDWHPTYTRPNGDVITFPEISFEDAPLQILEALKLGVTQYLPLPSEEGDDDTDHLFKGIVEYDPQSALKSIEQSMEVSGGYGQYELAVRARNSIDPKSFDTMQINSESAIDAFAQVRALDDQKFIIADRARIIANIVKGLKPVDEYIAPRLGNLNIYGSSQGPIALIKRECINVITQYKQDVAAEVANLQEPWWLVELGNNEYYIHAVSLIKYMRASMYRSNIITNPDTAAVTAVTNNDQDEILEQYMEQMTDQETRAKFLLAFWHACWMVPTSSGKITDQPVFGTCMFQYLLDALIYFGIAHKPFVTNEGHIEQHDLLQFLGQGMMEAECMSCGDVLELKVSNVKHYWKAEGSCKKCNTIPVD